MSDATYETLTSSLIQALSILFFCFIFWVVGRFFTPQEKKLSFLNYLGLSSFVWNKKLTLFLLGAFTLGALSTLLIYFTDSSYLMFLHSENNPYSSMLKLPFGIDLLVSLCAYTFIKASLSEEILFRGFISKRLIQYFGFKAGNLIQALIFTLLHNLLLFAVLKQVFTPIQIITFASTFAMSLFICYYNEKVAHGSIGPSWLFHGFVNFSAFFAIYFAIN